MRRGKPLRVMAKLKDEFSFVRGNYLVLVLSWIFMDFTREIPGTYYSLYVLALEGTPFAIGLIGFVSSLALASVQFPGGYLADKYGRRWLVSTMTFGVAISYIFYAIAPSWHVILLGAVFSNLCLIYQPALLAMIADSLPSERRGMGYSIITLIESVATTPGPVIAGILYMGFGLVGSVRISYVIATAFFLIAAALRLRLKETIVDPRKIKPKELLSAYPVALKESVKVWGAVPRAMLYLFFSNLLGMFALAMVFPYTVVYAVQVLGISELQWSLLLTFLFIAMIISALPAGKFIDKVGRKIPLLTSFLLRAFAVLLFVYSDFSTLFVALPLFGLSQILTMSAYGSLQADLVPQEQRGKVIGFTNFFNNIITSIGVLAGGILYSAISPQLPFMLLLVLVVPEFLILLFWVQEPQKREA